MAEPTQRAIEAVWRIERSRIVAGVARLVRDVARHSDTSEATVRTQVKSILAKLQVSSQLAAVGQAYRIGWRPPFDLPLKS